MSLVVLLIFIYYLFGEGDYPRMYDIQIAFEKVCLLHSNAFTLMNRAGLYRAKASLLWTLGLVSERQAQAVSPEVEDLEWLGGVIKKKKKVAPSFSYLTVQVWASFLSYLRISFIPYT